MCSLYFLGSMLATYVIMPFVFIGEQCIEVFWREANKRNICIALRQKVPSDANNETYENVSLLDSKPKINILYYVT